MIALQMRFAAGTMHAPPWARATAGEIEWPPEPWRLLQALVKGWICLSRPDRERFLALIERFSPPPIYRLPFATSGSSRSPIATSDIQTPPRTIAYDSVLALESEHDVSAFAIWPDALLDAGDMALLDAVLSSISDIRQCSFARVESADSDSAEGPFYDASPCGDRVRAGSIILERTTARGGIAGEVLLASLEASDPREAPLLSGVRTKTGYEIPQHWGLVGSFIAAPPRIAPGAFRFHVDPQVRVDITATLPFAEAFRGALLSSYSSLHGQPASRRLAGKNDDDGSPRRGHDHPHYLPHDLDGNGQIDTVDVYFPTGCTHDEYIALRSVLHVYDSASLRRRVNVHFSGAAPVPVGSVWESLSPVILDRFPKRRGPNGAREVDSPAEQIRSALFRRGLPDPRVSIWPATTAYGADRNDRMSAAFRRTRGKQPSYPAVGATLVFDLEVAGPIALGRLAHFGLGNFGPVATSTALPTNEVALSNGQHW